MSIIQRRNKDLNDGWSLRQHGRHLTPQRSRRQTHSRQHPNNEALEEREHYEQLNRQQAASYQQGDEQTTGYFARGRLGRVGYILFYPITMLSAFIFIALGQALDPAAGAEDMSAIGILFTLVGALFAFVMVGNNVARRFKDIGVSGWTGLTVAIPWIGVLIALAIAFIPGTNGTNQNGPAPAQININRTAITLAALMGLAVLAGNLGFSK